MGPAIKTKSVRRPITKRTGVLTPSTTGKKLLKSRLFAPCQWCSSWIISTASLEKCNNDHGISYDGKTLIPKHTIINDQNGLVVKKGIIGQPNRVYKLTADQGLDFQKRMQRTLTINSAFEWIKFGKWYLKWRDTYSTALS